MSTQKPICFVVSKDLMFSSQIASAATAAGFSTQTVFSGEQVTDDSGTSLYVVLDLTLPGLDIANAVTKLKANGAKVVAVGPHVHEAKLTSARESGSDRVLTKGQATREVGAVLVELSAAD